MCQDGRCSKVYKWGDLEDTHLHMLQWNTIAYTIAMLTFAVETRVIHLIKFNFCRVKNMGVAVRPKMSQGQVQRSARSSMHFNV